jgi:hypothetical protein
LALLEDENYVLQKLATTLATLYQRLGSEWRSPVRHVFASLVRRQYVPPDQVPTMAELLPVASECTPKQSASILRFSMTLAEDISSRVPGSTTQQQLSTGASDVLELIGHLLGIFWPGLTGPGVSEEGSGGGPLTLAQLAFEALPHWTGLLRLSEAHTSKEQAQIANKQAVACTMMALRGLEVPSMSTVALNALVMIQTLSPRLLVKADSSFPRSLATSAISQHWVTALLQGDSTPEALGFVDLVEAIMLQVDTTSTDYIHSGQYVEVMDLLITLMKCDGAAGVDDDVSQRILETIGTIVEGHTDWDPDTEAERYLAHFVGQVCETCLEKVKLPAEEMNLATRTWDKDDRARFQDFRYDVQDFLQSGFGLVGPPLLEAIARRATSAADWRDFEGSLYCLVAFTDIMIEEREQYDSLIESILSGAHFQAVVHSQSVPDVARKTCIKFISEMTAYLKTHPKLMEILNFLFSSLHLPASAAIASRAIYTLCDSQRSALTGALPGFLASLSTISDLRGMERHRIFGAVAALIQSTKDADGQLQPLLTVLGLLSQDVQQNDAMTSEDESFLEQNTDQIQTLAAIGRGLRAPTTTPIDLEDTKQNGAHAKNYFWLSGPGAIVQQRTIEIYRRIVARVGGHATSEFVEACCNFVRSGFTESHPSPFKFSSETSVDLITSHISTSSPNIDVVMVSAASLLAAASREEFRQQFPRLLQPILAGMQQLLDGPDRDQEIRNSSYPSASLDFMSRSFPSWGVELLKLDEAQQALAICFDLALLVIAEPDTLPRRAAAHFFGAYVELSKPGKLSPEDKGYNNMMALSTQYQPRVLASILRLVGGECARSELDVLAEQIRRYAHNQPMLFKTIGREAIKNESQVLGEGALQATTLEQRERFIAQVDGLRGARKTTDVVKDFWMACRGVDYGYVA